MTLMIIIQYVAVHAFRISAASVTFTALHSYMDSPHVTYMFYDLRDLGWRAIRHGIGSFC